MNEDFRYRTDDESDLSNIDNERDDDFYDEGDLSLGFVRYVGKESGDINVYEFMFTLYPDEFWGEGFEVMPCGICNYLEPDGKYIQKMVKVRMKQELNLIQDNGCFSMQDCMDGIVGLAWQNLIGLEEYPDMRLYFMFGESYTKVENKLAQCHILME